MGPVNIGFKNRRPSYVVNYGNTPLPLFQFYNVLQLDFQKRKQNVKCLLIVTLGYFNFTFWYTRAVVSSGCGGAIAVKREKVKNIVTLYIALPPHQNDVQEEIVAALGE